ncbi:MAG: class I SAM-dependent methyltransferase [Myxococcales bacterium]|nr:class I SAM-dependent methyltransferase [Myxococcales bacterium]
MAQQRPGHFFDQDLAKSYDARNRALSSISECMHFLIRLVLNGLPARARILSVGVGTGAEVLSLAKAYPEWTFVAVDPSQPMLDVCRERLEAAGFSERCELLHGQVEDVPPGETFDAAVSVLVGHFVPRTERQAFYENMVQRLVPNGTLVCTEISYDLESPAFPAMLRDWEQVQSLMGGTPESLAKLPEVLKSTLTVLPGAEVESLLRRSGIETPVCFFQAFMIAGWHGTRRG